MDISFALPTFVITLREGVEAALVVGIVLAYLRKSRQRHLTPWVTGGVFVGLGLSAIVGAVLSHLIHWLSTASPQYASVIELGLEGTFGVIAIGLLSWMLLWMTRNARTLKSDVEHAIARAVKRDTQAGWGIFSLVLMAVLREGFETVFFVAGKFQQGILPALGAIAGIGTAAGMGMLLFRWGIKLNLQRFFLVMGSLLLLIVAGLVITALGNFDTALHQLADFDRKSAALCIFQEHFVKRANQSCILGPMVWNWSRVLPDDRFPGVILNALLGYRDRLFFVQGLSYGVFLITFGSLYFQSLTGRVISFPLRRLHPSSGESTAHRN